ncbi:MULTISPECIES: hypothetical protein [Methanothrix]|jgi:hypothetical protein|uniref:hypothetical protein n=1 Tax=Methanothrix TaxID=2222 RepID=UPI001E713577|nr:MULTISPECIES: hypothetical protein [Methanothrix]HOT08075.1 hypothetical protein [Methanotrichaceae archaeon]MDY0412351.1 hypothetical protein [Methanothrix soehngenii]UEC40084.1 MAG: conserved membrane protein of unknown function [Methanothrix sp.]HOI21417.1 hypothetical protein [Methanothrix soehngenii]HQI54962.1 hypothetical protein [Methanothrix soehngenii]
MKEFSVRTGRLLGIYALVLGVGYGAQALAETIGGRESFPGGILSIAVLLVISATYLMGAKSLVAGRREGLSFLMGGLFLSGAVGGLYLLMTGADWLMYLLGEVEDFALLSEISPATVLLIVALPLVPMMRKMTRGMAW